MGIEMKKARRIPTMHWFFKLFKYLSVLEPQDSVSSVKSWLSHVYKKRYFLPLEIRKSLVSSVIECSAKILRSDSSKWLSDIQYLDFLSTKQGIFCMPTAIFKNSSVLCFILDGFGTMVQRLCGVLDSDLRPCLECIIHQFVAFLQENSNLQEIGGNVCLKAGERILQLLVQSKDSIPVNAIDMFVEFIASLALDDRYTVRVASCNLFPQTLDCFREPSVRILFFVNMVHGPC